MQLHFQLYSSRKAPSQTAFLRTLADLGYSGVEGFGGIYDNPAAFRDAMDGTGLKMPSGHFALADLQEDFDNCTGIARTLGMTHIFAPYLDATDRPADRDDWTALANRLATLARRASDAGFVFGWHNHDFELIPLRCGSVPLDILLTQARALAWEADLAWVIRGGADAGALLGRFGEKLAALHIKDIARPGENLEQDGWADVGCGVVDWPDLISRARSVAPGALMIVEHDNPADPATFAATSFAAVRAMTEDAA